MGRSATTTSQFLRIRELLSEYDVVLLDLDGVLVHGGAMIEGAGDALRWVAERRVMFVCSNSMRRTPEAISGAFARERIDVPAEQIVTSSRVLERQVAPGGALARTEPRRALAFGCEGLEARYRPYGIELVVDAGVAVELVIIGAIEPSTFRYDTVASALRAVMAGAPVVATSMDLSVPSAAGFQPGSGVLARYLQDVAASASAPFMNIGKPSPVYFDTLKRLVPGIDGKVLFVGDTLRADVLGAQRAGFDTLLVLSGNEAGTDVAAGEIRPDWIADRFNLDAPCRRGQR